VVRGADRKVIFFQGERLQRCVAAAFSEILGKQIIVPRTTASLEHRHGVDRARPHEDTAKSQLSWL